MPGSAACPPTIPNLVITAQTAVLGIVAFLAILAFIWLLATMSPTSDLRSALLKLGGIAVGAVVGVVVTLAVVPQFAIINVAAFPAEPIVLILALPLVALAVFVLTARDARRFVVGLVSAAVAWFLVVYPNISALPLPTVVANAFQGVLPTYPYPFQFPTNRTEVVKDVHLLDPIALAIAGSLVLLSIVIAYSAWIWRIAIAERRAAEADSAAGGFMSGSPGG